MSSLPLLSKVISAISKFCVATIPHMPSYFVELLHNELSNTHHKFKRENNLVGRKEIMPHESSKY